MIGTDRIHRWLTLILLLIMMAGLTFALYEHQWLNAFLTSGILVLTLLPAMLGRRFRVYIPPDIQLIAAVFIFSSLFLGETRGYYVKFWWWDILLHTGSGFLLGILGFLLVYVLNEQEDISLSINPGFVALFSFTFAVAIGAMWEIFEFVMDQSLGLNMQKTGLVDTMSDLIVDTIGAAGVAAIGYGYMKSNTSSFLSRWIRVFVEKNPRLFCRRRIGAGREGAVQRLNTPRRRSRARLSGESGFKQDRIRTGDG